MLIGAVLTAASGGEHRRAPPAPGQILLNAATGEIRTDLPVGDSQGLSRFGYGFLWTIGSNGIMSQVDPRTSRLVRSIAVGVQAGGITTGAGGIWVTDRNGPGLLRIDPVTGEINLRARLSTLGLRGPETNGGIVLDAGSLWVARGAEAVDRLNPSSLKQQHRVMLGQGGCGAGTAPQCDVAAGGGRVWVVAGASGSLTGIREATDQVIAKARLRPYACCVAVGGGSVWVAEAHDIARLSPDGRLLRRFGVTSAGIGNISYDHGYLWATADTTGQLLRIGARDDHVRTIHLGNLLIGTVAGDGVVVANAWRSRTPRRAAWAPGSSGSGWPWTGSTSPIRRSPARPPAPGAGNGSYSTPPAPSSTSTRTPAAPPARTCVLRLPLALHASRPTGAPRRSRYAPTCASRRRSTDRSPPTTSAAR